MTLGERGKGSVLADLWLDLRYGLRMLRKTPGLTAFALAMLALGIGANTATFSIVDSLLLKSLPVRNPDGLVRVTSGTRSSFSQPVWEQICERRVFEGAFAWSFARLDLAQGGETELVQCIWAGGGFFDVLGLTAILGRTFNEVDDRPGGVREGPVAVISYEFWQRRFGGAPEAVG